MFLITEKYRGVVDICVNSLWIWFLIARSQNHNFFPQYHYILWDSKKKYIMLYFFLDTT